MERIDLTTGITKEEYDAQMASRSADLTQDPMYNHDEGSPTFRAAPHLKHVEAARTNPDAPRDGVRPAANHPIFGDEAHGPAYRA